MKHLLAAALVAILSVAATPSVAQDKKADPPKDTPSAATGKDEAGKKAEAKAADATKDAKDAKDAKKKVRKGGC